ncbi:unnamed protein product [Pleuronectes platessa]|uniref:Uncharacterized protein n=1 Tax=Pleuronectes platessa TaxID=8262 RepID=A0A9N7VUP8_PLEPL|nr:unnamed protein product [Pleuronectes platessa]
MNQILFSCAQGPPRLISCGQEPCWKVSNEAVYPSSHTPPAALSSSGPALLFLHELALSDSCEGLHRLLVAHGIPICRPACRASRKAGRLQRPPAHPPYSFPAKSPAPPLPSHQAW